MNNGIIKIDDLLDVIIKRRKMIICLTIIATILSAFVSFVIIPPKYVAATKVFIGKELNNQGQEQSYNTNDVQMYQKLIKTYAEIIQTNDLIQRAINSSNLDLKSENVLNTLSVNPRTDTQILEISYISANKALASDVVSAVTNEFIRTSKEIIPNGNVRVIESVKVPENPISPNKKLYIGIAFLVGLIGSIGLSFLLEFMDNTFKTREQIEELLGIPVLGTIPDGNK
ncbi:MULTISPECIES: Wzz/FepE/Etk N-terminal domain-containing protein [unclassified Clostridium]|uniref:YveK family protein n=1 Tax=unclassified Clostridium TaxID=2614128 RepID=UPI000297FB42|nr:MULTISPECIES: Wzz/FepE/Etk N-terminal domain-containing protein [unclassified Clostridium]EKQ56650.1 MAG: capsular polysaccharide biosynthesis protein [Clostridium sp. Maddingley MBC34-26]